MSTKQIKAGLSKANVNAIAGAIGTATLNRLVPQFSTSIAYSKGQYTNYNNVLYRFTANKSAGAWDSSKVEAASLNDLIDDVNYAVASVSGKANTVDLLNGTLVPAKSLVSEQLENISEDSGTTQDNPFTFQATATDGGAGASDTAPTAKYLKLKGKTYCFNQLMKNGNFSENAGWGGNTGTGDFSSISIANNVLTQTYTGTPDASYKSGIVTTYGYRPDIIKDHYYLVKVKFRASKSCSVQAYTSGTGYWESKSVNANVWYYYGAIKKATSTELGTSLLFSITDATILGNGDTLEFAECELFDITQLFNGDIPEEITNGVSLPDYNLTFTGVDIFNQLFPLPYYSYNAGTLVSANATKLTTLGKNQFNGVFVVGGLDDDTGEETTNDRFKRSGFIKVIPSQTYMLLQSGGINSKTSAQRRIYEYDGNKNFIKRTFYYNNISQFNSPITCLLTSDTQYIRISYYDNTKELDISNACFFIAWLEDGTTSRQGYEEYVKHEYDLGSELEEHPLLSAGSACDIKLPNGTITRKIGVVDLGTLDWEYNSSYGIFTCSSWKTISPQANAGEQGELGNLICSKYATHTNAYNSQVSDYDKIIFNQPLVNTRLFVKDTSYTDAATFKTAMSGVYLYYELATPTEEQGDSFPEVIEVDDFGTMEYGGTNYNDYPQGCEFFYPADYVLFIDTLGNGVDWEAGDIAKNSELNSKFETYLKSLTGYDNTKTQTLKNVSGTLTWVDA